MKWEYKVYKERARGLFGSDIDSGEFEDTLNDFGEAGWDVVSVFDTNFGQGGTDWIVAILKRPDNN